ENYLNLYYKGNSVANISLKASGEYRVEIHEKFFNGTKADNQEFLISKKQVRNNYVQVLLGAEKPPSRFLQKAHIDEFCSRVRIVNYGEEIEFEQALITDNLEREDLIITDRQISDHEFSKRLDLLALKQLVPGENRYRFIALEVKLGKNHELKEKVASQLREYIDHIQEHIQDYCQCYQLQYAQKKELGIIRDIPYEAIVIEKEVAGWVIVGGYSKIAEASIKELRKNNPDIKVKHFSYKLEI
ncbi:MAG: hypothetical protein JW757_09935, partial [Anaerolineales bacterium]|nr:hypothetical protein [Anaerolineales bacterium]